MGEFGGGGGYVGGYIVYTPTCGVILFVCLRGHTSQGHVSVHKYLSGRRLTHCASIIG